MSVVHISNVLVPGACCGCGATSGRPKSERAGDPLYVDDGCECVNSTGVRVWGWVLHDIGAFPCGLNWDTAGTQSERSCGEIWSRGAMLYDAGECEGAWGASVEKMSVKFYRNRTVCINITHNENARA
jgi:hypothetical protein